MRKNLKDILYKNADILSSIDKMIYYLRIQNYNRALSYSEHINNQTVELLPLVVEEIKFFNQEFEMLNLDIITEQLTGIMQAQAHKDYVLLADLYELQFQPFLYQLQEHIIAHEDTSDEELYPINIAAMKQHEEELYQLFLQQEFKFNEISQIYHIEDTSCGIRTLAIHDQDNTTYLHSNKNLISDAYFLANSWYDENKSEYVIYGLGLGYHIWELAKIDNSTIINVYESDINLIYMACLCSSLYFLFWNPNVRIHYDPQFSKLEKKLEQMNDDTEFVIHYPSLCLIRDTVIKSKLEGYFIQYSSIKNQMQFMNRNFIQNIKHFDSVVDKLKDKFSGKDLYVVASGPSLDTNFMRLKGIGKDAIVLATGTVLKKLLDAGIIPDYFIVSDANQRVYHQIKELEHENIPMIYISTAYHGFAKNYQGKKYIVCQSGYKKSEEFAKEHNYDLYQTGGSVSTIAIDLGIHFNCQRIVVMGLDLSYSNNLVHADSTSRRELKSTENLLEVNDINGNLVYTSRALNMYREWIEKRISHVTGIEFINATEGGVPIKGMKHQRLSEIIK